MNNCNLSVIALPWAQFTAAGLAHERSKHGGFAADFDLAVAEFAKDGCDITLHERLTALGCDSAEIAWHIARPGQRMPQAYG